MSDVNAQDAGLIGSAEDVLHLYEGAGDQAKTGVEVEIPFVRADETLSPMDGAGNEAVLRKAADRGLGIAREPSPDMLEIASIAAPFERLDAVIGDTLAKTRALTDIAQTLGFKRSWFEQPPRTRAGDLLADIVPVPRYQAFFNPVRADMEGIARYFVLSKSVQVSVSYRDTDHMLDNVRRLYALAPFLFLLSDGSGGFLDGDPRPASGHPGMELRSALGRRGGVPDMLYAALDGDAYIRMHIDAVMNAPLFVHYDREGTLVRLPSGTFTSFNALRGRGLNTGANYYLAQSVLWPDVKIAALKDGESSVFGHRFEARMFGTGLHQPQTALLIVAGLAFHEDFAAKTDALLRRFGFDFSSDIKNIIDSGYDSARRHQGRFFDTRYGTGTMRDFARAFADLLEDAYAGIGLENRLIPALHICRTGRTDGLANREAFGTYEDALAFQRDYDLALFTEENTCADLLFSHIQNRRCPAHTAHSSTGVCA